MKSDISITRGRTYMFDICVKDSEGEPYVLQSDEKLIFGIKKLYTDPIYIFKKILTIDDATDTGVYSLKIEPKDTLRLICGAYCFDVGMKREDDYFSVIDYSTLILEKNVTKG